MLAYFALMKAANRLISDFFFSYIFCKSLFPCFIVGDLRVAASTDSHHVPEQAITLSATRWRQRNHKGSTESQ